MLLDSFLPEYHFNEKHRIEVNRPPAEVYSHILTADFGSTPVIKTLFTLRGLPLEMRSLQTFLNHRFLLLGDAPGQELVLGVVIDPARFSAVAINPADFIHHRRPDHVKVAFNFRVQDRPGGSLLTTETRILCGPEAKRRFSLYWFVVRPASGLTRRVMLKCMKNAAEGQG